MSILQARLKNLPKQNWVENVSLVGGFNNPFKKYARQNGNHPPQISG